MAAIDYYGIETIVQSTIISEMGSGSLVNVTVEVTQPMDTRPWVAIYLKNRVDSDIQVCAGGTIKKYSLEFSIWCWGWSLNNPADAARARDELIGDVEIALMKNRKMGGAVDNGTIHGGEFGTAEAPAKGTLMGGEIVYRVEVKATT